MTSTAYDFNSLIRDAAPAVPDCNLDRRVTRALLHERMRSVRRRQRQRRVRGMALAASATFLLVLAGHVGQLGSDGFEFALVPLEIGSGVTVNVAKSPIRGKYLAAAPDMSREAVRELGEAAMLREGRVKKIWAAELEGAAPFWQIDVVYTVDGKPVDLTRNPLSLDVRHGPPTRTMLKFIQTEFEDFMALVDSGQIQGEPYGHVTADDLVFEVQRWSKVYPEWGRFNYYCGLPAGAPNSPVN